MLVMSFFYSIYSMLCGDFDTTAWILPMHLVVPFGTDTLWGWYLMLIIQINMSLAYALCVVPITAYFVSCCFYIGTICDHFDRLIQSSSKFFKVINENRQCHRTARVSVKTHEKAKERFCEGINLHIEIFE